MACEKTHDGLWCISVGDKEEPTAAAWVLLGRLAATFDVEPRDPHEADVCISIVHTPIKQAPGLKTLPSKHMFDPRTDIEGNISRVCVFVFYAFQDTRMLVLCGTMTTVELSIQGYAVNLRLLARSSLRQHLVLWSGVRYRYVPPKRSFAIFTVVNTNYEIKRTDIVEYTEWRLRMLSDLYMLVYSKPLSEAQRFDACRLWHRNTFEPYTEKMYTKDMRSYVLTRTLVGFMNNCPWYQDAECLLLEIRTRMTCWTHEQWQTVVRDALIETPFQMLGVDERQPQTRKFLDPNVDFYQLPFSIKCRDDAVSLRAASIKDMNGRYFASSHAIWDWFYTQFAGIREATPFDLLGIQKDAPAHIACDKCTMDGAYFYALPQTHVRRFEQLVARATETPCPTMMHMEDAIQYVSARVLWDWFRTQFASGFDTDAITTELERKRAYLDGMDSQKVLYDHMETLHPPRIRHWYKVPFEEATSLLARRNVMLYKGDMYVPWFFMHHVFSYRMRQTTQMIHDACCTPKTLKLLTRTVDENSGKWLKALSIRVSRRHNNVRAYIQNISRVHDLPTINDLVRLMPPCMRNIARVLMTKHHIGNVLRFRYVPFLFKLGYSLEEVECHFMDYWDKDRLVTWTKEKAYKDIQRWSKAASESKKTLKSGLKRKHMVFGCNALADSGDLYDIEDLVSTTLVGARQQKCAQFRAILRPDTRTFDAVWSPYYFVVGPKKKKGVESNS